MSVKLRAACLLLPWLLSAPVLHAEPVYNQVSLRAEVSTDVAHDLMQVTLYTEAQDKDAAKLSNQITQTLNAALAKARAVKAVTPSQGSRHSYAVYDDKGTTITAWRERAELRLESEDFAALSTLTGELLGELRMGQMDFTLSKKLRKSGEEALIKEAIEAFNARATTITQALGGKSYKLVSLSLDSAGFAPPMLRAVQAASPAFASKMMDTPEVEAGSSQVSLSASGVIEVQVP